MKEWESNFNPFNSMKILVWREWLEACARGEYLRPITVAIDPTNKCNLDCIWCNAYDIRGQGAHELTEKNAIDLADFLKDWGVGANCIAGGGEPLMAKSFPVLLERCYHNGISNSVITNGTLLNDELIDLIARTCTWIGISVDSGSPDTYCKVKGIKNENYFPKLITNIKKLRSRIDELKSKCTIGYKFLIHPYNQGEIYATAKLAKEMGITDMQFRPVGWDNITITKDEEPLVYDHELIDRQLAAALELGTKDFHVYGVRHKFNNDFSKKNKFSKCWAISMHPTFAADGNLYICMDKRGNKDEILCQYLPYPGEVLKHWNSLRHKEMMRSIDVSKCPRCTFGGYNEICEEVFATDKMVRNHI